jgi:hypothetical protein
MRILIALRHAGYLRHFRSTIEELGERGHEVVLVLAKHVPTAARTRDIADDLRPNVAGLTVRTGVETHRRPERDLASGLRDWLTYLWFLEPGLRAASKARERALRGVPAGLHGTAAALSNHPDLLHAVRTSVQGIERLLPPPAQFKELIESEAPDAVVVSPLLDKGTPQINYLRAARELGIGTGLCVASWDNLTNKAPILDPVDLVAVWNQAQVEEAVNLHQVPRERVVVTGAPVYDQWFGRKPATSRAEFCLSLGLPPDRPFLLYVCSSGFIAPDEAKWIPRWLSTIRESGLPELADVPVLIRPHPQKPLLAGDGGKRLADLPHVVVHPPHGELAITEAAISDYYEAIHHSAAVVGITTSAMIDASLAGRGVYSLLSRRYRESQDGLPHFDHLRRAGGGLIHATARPLEHAEALARALRGEDAVEAEARAHAFLAEFIRPHGLDRPVAPLLADALEALASQPRRAPEPAPSLPRARLDEIARELEPIFRIRRGRSVGAPREKRPRGRRKAGLQERSEPLAGRKSEHEHVDGPARDSVDEAGERVDRE